MDSYFIFLHKPVGITSQQLLNRYKRTLPKKTKVGHHGTLDPFASGMMLVAVGEACKFISYVDDSQKTYVATLKLGQKTDTADLTGRVTENRPIPTSVTEEKIRAAFQEFIGVTEQMPPMYSAIKIDGVPLYKKARAGEVVERKPRQIEIFDLKLLNFSPSPGTPDESLCIQFEVICSRGTYVRTLAEDLAVKLGTVGHLTALRRTKLCGISIDYNGDEAKAKGDGDQDDSLDNLFSKAKPIEISDLLRHHTCVDLTEEEMIMVYQGKRISKSIEALDQIVALFHNSQFCGMAQIQNQLLTVKRLLAQHAG